MGAPERRSQRDLSVHAAPGGHQGRGVGEPAEFPTDVQDVLAMCAPAEAYSAMARGCTGWRRRSAVISRKKSDCGWSSTRLVPSSTVEECPMPELILDYDRPNANVSPHQHVCTNPRHTPARVWTYTQSNCLRTGAWPQCEVCRPRLPPSPPCNCGICPCPSRVTPLRESVWT
jgi:hypothetical protein